MRVSVDVNSFLVSRDGEGDADHVVSHVHVRIGSVWCVGILCVKLYLDCE